jgi:hypothetical protein
VIERPEALEGVETHEPPIEEGSERR